MTLFKFILPLCLACALYGTAQAAPSASPLATTSDPLSTAQSIEQAMSAEIKRQHVTENSDPAVMKQIVKDVILPHADVHAMARSALGRDAWLKASYEDQEAFVAAFTDLMINTYAKGMGSYAGQTFQPMRPLQPGQNRTEIASKIITTKNANQTISVLYRVVQDSKTLEWKLYDFSVEGISMINSFRAQFQDKLSAGTSLKELTKEVKTHNEINNPKS